MGYKGIVYILGPSPSLAGMRSLRGRDSGWGQYFSELRDVSPIDGKKTAYSKPLEREVDITLMEGKIKGTQDYVLFCPTHARVVKNNGRIRARAKYMEDSGASIGLGFAGGFYPGAEWGDVMLPSSAYCSDNLKKKFDGPQEETETGYSDSRIQDSIAGHLDNERVIRAENILTVADIQEVLDIAPEMGNIYREGVSGSDMETAWYLRHCNIQNKPAGSVLVVSDRPSDKPFTTTYTGPLEPLYELPHWKNMDRVVEAAAKTILER